MTPRRISVVALALATAVALTGCGGSTPHSAAASSASPTPTPTPVPLVAAQVQLTHDALVVVSSTNVTMATIPWSTVPETAVAELGTYFGSAAPIVAHPGGSCAADYSEALWGSTTATESALRVIWWTDTANRGPDSQFWVESFAPTAGNVTVDTAQGFKVGDSGAAALAGTPGASQPNGPSQIWTELDSNQVGVLIGLGDDGKIQSMQDPAYVQQDC